MNPQTQGAPAPALAETAAQLRATVAALSQSLGCAPANSSLGPIAPAALTRAWPFGHLPQLDQHLFAVNPGVCARAAQNEAICLLVCARERVEDGLEEGLKPTDCHLVAFALTAAIGLLTASGAYE